MAWVDQLNSAMNRGAAAAQLAIGSEDENAALDPNELGRMVLEKGWIEGQAMEKLTAHCKRQEDLVATRISDMVQIVDVVVKALNDAQQRCLALEAQKNAAGTQGNKAGNTLGIGGMGTSEILSLRERERQLKELLDEIASGRYGSFGDVFMTTRDLASYKKVSLKTAFRWMMW